MFDPHQIRQQFPILQQTLPKGRKVTYLDTAASAQKPQVVIDREREVYENFYANAYRGVYRFGALVDEALEATREQVAKFIGADSSEQVVFTAGATMSLNIIAQGWGRRFLEPNDEILLNEMEHHANLVPWQMIASERGAKLRFIPLTADGQLDMSRLDEVLTSRTKLVAVTGMSNVLGTIPPIRELVRRAHAVGAVIAVDAAQSVPHLETNVVRDGIDFMAFSGHKLYGPSGVGIMYGRPDLLAAMHPVLGGGHMIERVYKEHSTWSDAPAKFEAGTLPITQAIALGTAITFVESLGPEACQRHEHDLLIYAHARLSEIRGLRIFGPAPEHKGGIASFVIDGVSAEDLAQLLDLRGVYVRHGHHCTMPLHDLLGIPASIRVSFGVYNTREDVDTLIDSLQHACDKLR